MPFELVIGSGTDKGQRLELKPGRYRLGRAPDNDFPIDDPTVSGTHCELTVGEDITVRDLGSTNGTFIDGKRISEAAIKVGQTLKLGDVDMALQTAVVISVPKVDFSAAPPPPPLEDGSLACANHPTIAATFMCLTCRKSFCVPCVRRVRRVGGQMLVLCPICSAHCQLAPGKEIVRPKSLFGRLVKTLKLGRR